MNKSELSERLHHLDPGAMLPVEETMLIAAFKVPTLSDETVAAIEAFALEHRCTFVCRDHARAAPWFEKDDIY